MSAHLSMNLNCTPLIALKAFTVSAVCIASCTFSVHCNCNSPLSLHLLFTLQLHMSLFAFAVYSARAPCTYSMHGPFAEEFSVRLHRALHVHCAPVSAVTLKATHAQWTDIVHCTCILKLWATENLHCTCTVKMCGHWQCLQWQCTLSLHCKPVSAMPVYTKLAVFFMHIDM